MSSAMTSCANENNDLNRIIFYEGKKLAAVPINFAIEKWPNYTDFWFYPSKPFVTNASLTLPQSVRISVDCGR